MDGTILGQGSFIVPSGVPVQVVQIPSNADWMRVFNYTQFGTAGVESPSYGVEFWWQRGMPQGQGIVKYYSNTSTVLNGDVLESGGFTLVDFSGQSGTNALPALGNPVATTATTNAVRPVVSTGNTAGVFVGSVVRLSNTAQTDVNGIDMVVSAVTANTSFELLFAANELANVPGVIGGAGFYRIVNTEGPFYPARRYVTNITQATNPTISTSIPHGLTPGQSIRFNIPAVSGMIQLNPTAQNNYQYATVQTVVSDETFTIDINTTNFTAFTWPTVAQQPSSFPSFEPIGENTASALVLPGNQVPSVGGIQIPNTNTGILADSTVNTLFLGMLLGNGGDGMVLGTEITGPAGSAASDVVYWVAGKSTYGGL